LSFSSLEDTDGARPESLHVSDSGAQNDIEAPARAETPPQSSDGIHISDSASPTGPRNESTAESLRVSDSTSRIGRAPDNAHVSDSQGSIGARPDNARVSDGAPSSSIDIGSDFNDDSAENRRSALGATTSTLDEVTHTPAIQSGTSELVAPAKGPASPKIEGLSDVDAPPWRSGSGSGSGSNSSSGLAIVADVLQSIGVDLLDVRHSKRKGEGKNAKAKPAQEKKKEPTKPPFAPTQKKKDPPAPPPKPTAKPEPRRQRDSDLDLDGVEHVSGGARKKSIDDSIGGSIFSSS
jgi:hypothetical protein